MRNERNLDCVILAGGRGTRLYPLTEQKPKPLMKILDTTVLEHVIENAKRVLPRNITVSTGYKADMIDTFCKNNFSDVVCKREMIPLGTAGGVKNCVSNDFDALLVLSGDAVFDFDLSSAVAFHFENNNDVTIVTSRKEDPTEYGVVITDDKSNVVSFCEKPGWKSVRSDLVNTGIYLLSKNAVDRIPNGIEYDFSKNLFPSLLREGAKVMSYYCHGFWCDIGTLEEYYSCNSLAASGRLPFLHKSGIDEKELNKRGIHAEKEVYVSHLSFVGKNVRISGESILCDKTVIGDDCDIVSAIIGKSSRIGKGCSIDGAIIGENVSVGENCIVPEGTVIGDMCRISDGTVLKNKALIPSGKAVFEEDETDMEFSKKTTLFVDDGLAVFDNSKVFSELPALSLSVSAAFRKSENTPSSFAVMCGNGCSYLKNLICSGLLSKDEKVFDCGNGNEALCSFSVKKLETDAGLFLYEENGKAYVKIFSENGRPVDTQTERKIVTCRFALQNHEMSKSIKSALAGGIAVIDVKNIYENSLIRYLDSLLCGKDFDGMCINMLRDGVENNASQQVLFRVLTSKNCKIVNSGDKKTASVVVSDDGKCAKIRYGNLVLDHYHLCGAVVDNQYSSQLSDTVSVGSNMPTLIKDMMKTEFKKDAMHCITDDGVVCALTFLALMQMSGENIQEMLLKIPPFEIYTDDYVADVNRAATIEKLSGLYRDSKDDSGDGICLKLADGNVTVIPNRAKGFKIVAEAHSMEAAKELCEKIGKAIKE